VGLLTKVWESGALRGAPAEEAFFVPCDHAATTPDDIKSGRLTWWWA
jgi:phage tail sheath protein FI